MKKVFDIGMYDGADTAYYLECGYRVVAVEANPELVDHAKKQFEAQIGSGQLTCVHAAISHDGEEVELHLAGHDLGSSSLYTDRIAQHHRMGAITVPGVTLQRLFERYGLPDYLKVDIEGADRLCVLALTPDTCPTFLSFEVGHDLDELFAHVETIGFRRFKIISQNTFRELANQRSFLDRATLRLMSVMGYREPHMIRRARRFFVAGYSSGPVPWLSDGRWRSAEATRSRLHEVKASVGIGGWFDIQATTAG